MLFEKLTPRQNEVAKLVAQCLSNKEIAEKLNITESAVKHHTKQMYRRLGMVGIDYGETAWGMRSALVMKLAKMSGIAVLLLLLAIRGNAQSHSATLNWTQPVQSDTIASTQILRNGAPLASVPPTTLTYADSAVVSGSSYAYSLTNTDTSGNVSASVSAASVTIPTSSTPPPPPPCPNCPAVGANVQVIATANVRATNVAGGAGTVLGTEPSKAAGIVLAIGSQGSVSGDTTLFWVQVKFTTCTGSTLIAANCTGWVGNDNLTVVAAAPPPPPPNPTVTTSGDAITLKPTNVPCPSTYSGSLTIDGIVVAFTGTCK